MKELFELEVTLYLRRWRHSSFVKGLLDWKKMENHIKFKKLPILLLTDASSQMVNLNLLKKDIPGVLSLKLNVLVK